MSAKIIPFRTTGANTIGIPTPVEDMVETLRECWNDYPRRDSIIGECHECYAKVLRIELQRHRRTDELVCENCLD